MPVYTLKGILSQSVIVKIGALSVPYSTQTSGIQPVVPYARIYTFFQGGSLYRARRRRLRGLIRRPAPPCVPRVPVLPPSASLLMPGAGHEKTGTPLHSCFIINCETSYGHRLHALLHTLARRLLLFYFSVK